MFVNERTARQRTSQKFCRKGQSCIIRACRTPKLALKTNTALERVPVEEV